MSTGSTVVSTSEGRKSSCTIHAHARLLVLDPDRRHLTNDLSINLQPNSWTKHNCFKHHKNSDTFQNTDSVKSIKEHSNEITCDADRVITFITTNADVICSVLWISFLDSFPVSDCSAQSLMSFHYKHKLNSWKLLIDHRLPLRIDLLDINLINTLASFISFAVTFSTHALLKYYC